MTDRELHEAAQQGEQPFGWFKQSELEQAKRSGGSINLWLEKYDCDTPLYAGAATAAQPDHRAEFVRVIEFAIKQGIEAREFLDAWRHGDTSEWPEFTPAAPAKE